MYFLLLTNLHKFTSKKDGKIFLKIDKMRKSMTDKFESNNRTIVSVQESTFAPATRGPGDEVLVLVVPRILGRPQAAC